MASVSFSDPAILYEQPCALLGRQLLDYLEDGPLKSQEELLRNIVERLLPLFDKVPYQLHNTRHVVNKLLCAESLLYTGASIETQLYTDPEVVLLGTVLLELPYINNRSPFKPISLKKEGEQIRQLLLGDDYFKWAVQSKAYALIFHGTKLIPDPFTKEDRKKAWELLNEIELLAEVRNSTQKPTIIAKAYHDFYITESETHRQDTTYLAKKTYNFLRKRYLYLTKANKPQSELYQYNLRAVSIFTNFVKALSNMQEKDFVYLCQHCVLQEG